MYEVFEFVTGIIAIVGFFSAVVLSLFFYFRARNKERMALIEKGLYTQKQKKRPTNFGLKFGVFFIGLSAGIFMGHILAYHTSIKGVIAFFSMILLFGGVSLVISNFLISKKEESAH